MWNDLLTTALIGTERRALDLDNLPEAFKDLAAQLEGNAAQYHDAERTLLSLAGAMTLHRRVGQILPLSDAPPLDPCDLDDLPPCSPRAGLLLQQILALSQRGSHLQEWITQAAQAGQRVSEEYLPRFLTGLNRAGLPDHFYEVLGKRGHWLAQQNEGWSYAVLPQNDAEWETASFPARIEYLRRMRASDPAHARTLVESVWKSENTEKRPALLGTFHINLSRNDEPFLESVLEDRARDVRYVNTNLLAKLEGSAYSQRMIARAQSLIKFNGRGSKLTLSLTLPETYDESMRRDGIIQPPVEIASADRAAWLRDIVKMVPASYWLSGNWSPRDLVHAVNKAEEWTELITPVLTWIADRESHQELVAALLETGKLDIGMKVVVLGTARPDIREAYLLRVLNSSGSDDELFELFHKSLTFWSSSLSRAFIRKIAQILPNQNAVELFALARQLEFFTPGLSPDCVDDLQELANIENKNKQVWSRLVKQAVATLEFRRNIHKELNR